jgi:serine/threonine-protein kinase
VPGGETLFEEKGAAERASRGTSSLPADVLHEARGRLAWACFVLTAGFLFARFIPQLVFGGSPVDESVGDLAAGFAMLFALVLGVVSRGSRFETRHLLTWGLVFEVVASVAIAMSEFWNFYSPQLRELVPAIQLNGISWVCVWIVVFPALVPVPNRYAIVATLLSAATTPLVFVASSLYHDPPIPDEHLGDVLINSAINNAVAAGFAVVVSLVVRRLGRKVGEARQMGSYTLVELLGRGGMGEVWRAEHRLLARPAAVKLVRSDALAEPSSGAQAVERFEREAQVTASLVCPHTISLYDFGVATDGRFYYVMELLDGINLEELVARSGPLPPERAVHLLLQACSSLAEAHSQGLVHRDIKPANLFCCRYGLDVDFVKVLDFGVARAIHTASAPLGARPRLTEARALVGTPAYMAPEMVLGEVEPDERADIYALGCVAYWLLTGRMVFEDRSPMKVAIQHVNTPPLAPSRRVDTPIPAELDAVVLACLAKDPAERPPTMIALQQILQRVPQPTPWTAERGAQWWSEHMTSAAAPAAQPVGLESTRVAHPVAAD